MPRPVHLRPLLLAAVLVAVGVTLIRALLAGDGIGVVEYVGSAAIIAALAFALFRLSRDAFRRA